MRRSSGSAARRLCGAARFVVLLAVAVIASMALPVRASAQVPPAAVTRARVPGTPAAHVPQLPRASSTTRATSLPDADVQPAVPAPAKPPAPAEAPAGVQPFGANLFMGNFLRTREDGLNPDYAILPGDHVAVNAWGTVNMSSVFVVDGQGNIFIPEIGPVQLSGVRNANLSTVVRQAFQRIYARGFEVYTNLITAKPVAVFVTGGVNRPGRYAGIPSDSILFFLDQAGGIDPKLGSYRKISVLRTGKSVAEVDLYDFILKGHIASPQFKDGDTILVHQRGPAVELKGDVAAPATIEFRPGKFRGADALAVIPGAARANEVTIEGMRNGVPISRTMPLTTFAEFPLHDGATITLRGEGQADTILVNLEGEFKGSAVLAIRRGSRLVDVLNHIRVDPRLADTKSVHLKRPSVARAQKSSLDNSLQRLERSALLALSASNGESNIRRQEAELVLKFVERAQLIQPLGRVVTTQAGQQLNVVMEEGDIIVIPSRTNVVRVSGEVLMAQAVMYGPDLTVEDYIERAGGYTDRAEEGRIIVLHPNAEVEMGDLDMAVGPGDEVLVPPRVDIKEIQNIADITQIIYQIAVSAAVAIAIL